MLVRHRLLVETADGVAPVQGTALARSLYGELGDWTRLDMFVGGWVGVDPPESKATVEWHAANQQRIKAKRAERQASRALSK